MNNKSSNQNRANQTPRPQPGRPQTPSAINPKIAASSKSNRPAAPLQRPQLPGAKAVQPKMPVGRPSGAVTPPGKPAAPQRPLTAAKQSGARSPVIGGAANRKPAVIQRMEDKNQRRFTKAWNATQDVRVTDTQLQKSWRKTVPAKVLIISEGLGRDTGSNYEEKGTKVHRTYYPDPQETEQIKEKYRGKKLVPWDINNQYPLQKRYDLIIARSSICFCFNNYFACGGYHDEKQTLAALKQIAELLNRDNDKARAYLTSGTLVSTAGPKTEPRKAQAPFDIRFPDVRPDPVLVPANPDRWDARADTARFWAEIPGKFNDQNPEFVMLPINMGVVNQDVNEKDPPGWLFGFKIKRRKKRD